MENVVVVMGTGQNGSGHSRVGVGKHIVLADRSEANGLGSRGYGQCRLPDQRRDR